MRTIIDPRDNMQYISPLIKGLKKLFGYDT